MDLKGEDLSMVWATAEVARRRVVIVDSGENIFAIVDRLSGVRRK